MLAHAGRGAFDCGRSGMHWDDRYRPGRSGSLMQLPAALEEKFTQLLGRYPVKRSALIPMMMYAQDQFGFLSDEVLEEIAKRVDLTGLRGPKTWGTSRWR